MSLPWFRLYTEFAGDPKIQILAFEDQRHYVMLLCLKGNGTLDADAPSEAYRERLVAKALGLDPVSAVEAKRRLMEGGLIAGDWHPIRWDSRQFQSDYSTARVQKHREKLKGNVTETFQKRSETVIDQTQTQNRTEKIQRPLKTVSTEKPKESGNAKAESRSALAHIRTMTGRSP